MIKTDIQITVNSVKEAEQKIKEIQGKLLSFKETDYSKVSMDDKIKPHILIMDKEVSRAYENRGYFIFKYPFGNHNLHSTKEFFDINIFTNK